jgi:hypothetical protein
LTLGVSLRIADITDLGVASKSRRSHSPRTSGCTRAEVALTGKPPLLPHVYREQLREERAAMQRASVSPPAFVS